MSYAIFRNENYKKENLSNQYIKIRNNVYMIQKINTKLQNENNNFKFENQQLNEEKQKLLSA